MKRVFDEQEATRGLALAAINAPTITSWMVQDLCQQESCGMVLDAYAMLANVRGAAWLRELESVVVKLGGYSDLQEYARCSMEDTQKELNEVLEGFLDSLFDTPSDVHLVYGNDYNFTFFTWTGARD